MGRGTKTFSIDGFQYTVEQLGALKGRKIWLKLLKALAAPVRELQEADGGADGATIAKALASLIENLDENVAEELYEAFGATCRVQVGERQPLLEGPVFDEHFAADYVRMSRWLGECVVYNFASFLGDGALGKFSELASKAGSKLRSPTNSTGSSSGSSPTPEPPASPDAR